MNEAETRAELVDPALRAAGWAVASQTSVATRRETPASVDPMATAVDRPDRVSG